MLSTQITFIATCGALLLGQAHASTNSTTGIPLGLGQLRVKHGIMDAGCLTEEGLWTAKSIQDESCGTFFSVPVDLIHKEFSIMTVNSEPCGVEDGEFGCGKGFSGMHKSPTFQWTSALAGTLQVINPDDSEDGPTTRWYAEETPSDDDEAQTVTTESDDVSFSIVWMNDPRNGTTGIKPPSHS